MLDLPLLIACLLNYLLTHLPPASLSCLTLLLTSLPSYPPLHFLCILRVVRLGRISVAAWDSTCTQLAVGRI
jgi:hypothetical protein